MIVKKYDFCKKCNLEMCQNTAEYCLHAGQKGQVLICREHLLELASSLADIKNAILKCNKNKHKGENNEK